MAFVDNFVETRETFQKVGDEWNSARDLAKELGIPLMSAAERRQKLASIDLPINDEKFKSIVAELPEETMESDNFMVTALFNRIMAAENEEEFKIITAGLRETLKKSYRISIPGDSLIIEGVNRIRAGEFELGMLNLMNMAFHTTTVENALSDLDAGRFRPASCFTEGTLNNTITRKILTSNNPEHYKQYLSLGHQKYVFFNSASMGNLVHQSNTYGENNPIVFSVDKKDLAGLGVKQESNWTFYRYYGEVRLEGEVPVLSSNMIFLDKKHVGEETQDRLRSVASIYDVSVLAVLDVIAGLMQIDNVDSRLRVVSDLPRGEFEYKISAPLFDSNGKARGMYEEEVVEKDRLGSYLLKAYHLQ